MKYFFQRPPVKSDIVVKVLENQAENSLTFVVFENIQGKELVLLSSTTFFIADIFVENFYALVPIKDKKILPPVNMDTYRGKIGVTELLKKVYQFDDFISYIIFGNEAKLDKTSILALYDFQFEPEKTANLGNHIDFYDVVAMAVDEPAKIRLDAEKRKTVLSISSNDSLSGLEAQVDILSGVVIGLIERLSVIQPELRQELLQETPLQKFEQVYKDTAITNLKDADSTLDEMKRQKTAVRKEQKRYFGERDKILGIKILKNTK